MPPEPPPSHLLLIRPSALGDVCRTVPLVASLRRAFPDATIDWVVQDGFVEAVEAHPAVNRVIPFPRKRLSAWWRSPRIAREASQFLWSLRRMKYDLVIDAQGLGRSGLMTLATRAPERIGSASARELAPLAYTRRVRSRGEVHAVEAMLSLLRPLGVDAVHDLRLFTREPDRAWWQAERTALQLEEPYLVLAPTSRWSSKQWPGERWAALVEPLQARTGERIVLIGAPGEEAQVLPIIDRLPPRVRDQVVNLVGRTRVGQTMAVIAGSSLVVANDSAPLHMAVGFERPLVGLFGPTDPARVGPFGREDSVIHPVTREELQQINYRDRALGDRLMRRISVDDVLAQVDVALRGKPPGRRAELAPVGAAPEAEAR